LKAQFQTYAVSSHTILCLCHKPYDEKNNIFLTPNNQCPIVVTVAYALGHATGTGL